MEHDKDNHFWLPPYRPGWALTGASDPYLRKSFAGRPRPTIFRMGKVGQDDWPLLSGSRSNEPVKCLVDSK